MLDGRDYMRGRNTNKYNLGCVFGPGAVWTLIFINVAVFILEISNKSIIHYFSLVSPLVLNSGEIYRIFTYMFLHGSFWHLFFNMWALYVFGLVLEERVGTHKFYLIYFISGIFGAGLWILFNQNNFDCIGASGAVFGIMIAVAMFYPDMKIMLLFPPVALKMKTFALVYAGIEILLEWSNAGGNIAHIVHLGGGLGGFLYVKIFYGKEVWAFSSIFRKTSNHRLFDKKNNFFFSEPQKVSQAELDRILDKISSDGINSLSENEMEILRRAREEMTGKK
jgi:membrane associated rhomboid family serine protease